MRHTVTFSVPTRDLGKADIDFLISANGKAFGKLEVSKGAIVWYPKDRTWGHKASWARFDQLMQEEPARERRKARRQRRRRSPPSS